MIDFKNESIHVKTWPEFLNHQHRFVWRPYRNALLAILCNTPHCLKLSKMTRFLQLPYSGRLLNKKVFHNQSWPVSPPGNTGRWFDSWDRLCGSARSVGSRG